MLLGTRAFGHMPDLAVRSLHLVGQTPRVRTARVVWGMANRSPETDTFESTSLIADGRRQECRSRTKVSGQAVVPVPSAGWPIPTCGKTGRSTTGATGFAVPSCDKVETGGDGLRLSGPRDLAQVADENEESTRPLGDWADPWAIPESHWKIV